MAASFFFDSLLSKLYPLLVSSNSELFVWNSVHGVAGNWTRLSDFTFTLHFHALEKEMATHSSVLAWRIPGTEEPGELPSLGSHRVGHDWSDLAAAAAAWADSSDCGLFFVFLPCPLTWKISSSSEIRHLLGSNICFYFLRDHYLVRPVVQWFFVVVVAVILYLLSVFFFF